MIAYLTTDLLFASRVASASVHSVPSAAAALEFCREQPVRLVVIDLGLPGLDLENLLPQLKSLPSPPPILAYGPHVQAERLAAARRLGCDEVLTRGQFHARMGEIFAAG